MTDAPNLWLFIGPFALAAALPGPAQGALVAQVLARGGHSSLPFAFGMMLGTAIWLSAAVFGLAAIAFRFESAFVLIKWLGVVYLLFVSYQLWRSDPSIAAPQLRKAGRLLAGMAVTLGNPKAVVFFGAVLPHAFDLSSLSAGQAAVIIGIGLTVDSLVQLSYVAMASRLRHLFTVPSRVRVANRSFAGLMAGSAMLIAARR